MKELSRTRRLTIAMMIFVLIIILGFITLKPPKYEYKLSTDQILEELKNEDEFVSPVQLAKDMSSDQSPIVLVDIRSPYDYDMGHLKNAVNIPVSEILSKESISFFEEAKNQDAQVVLYGSDQLQANGPWMFLMQIGYHNIKLLLGGYNYYVNQSGSQPEPSEKSAYAIEEPDLDFSEFMEKRSSGFIGTKTTKEQPAQIIPVKRNKKSATAGGC
jgi:rhodanese-related sulfurtransferase